MIENLDKLTAISFSMLIFAQAYLVRRIVGTWIFPACLFSLAWFVYTFFPLVVLFSVPVEPLSIAFIFLCTFLFSLSALAFNWPKAFDANEQKTHDDAARFDSGFLRGLFYFSSITAIGSTVVSIGINGFDLTSMIFDLLETSGRYAAMRGQGDIDYGNWGRSSIVFTYIAATLGGFIYYKSQKSLSKICVILVAFLPSVFVVLTQSAKLILFLSLGFFCSAMLIRKIYDNQFKLISGKLFLQVVVGALLLLPLLAVSFLSRAVSSSEDGVVSAVSTSLFSYALAHVYAFSDWFSHYFKGESVQDYVDNYYAYGNYTFQSIYELLGDGVTFPPGVYDEYFSYENLFTSNLYTIFRGLIYDFGSGGALIFMFACGLVVHAFYYRLLVLNSSWVACVVFIISFVSFQSSFIISIFMARYMYLIGIVLIIFLYVNDIIWRRGARPVHVV